MDIGTVDYVENEVSENLLKDNPIAYVAGYLHAEKLWSQKNLRTTGTCFVSSRHTNRRKALEHFLHLQHHTVCHTARRPVCERFLDVYQECWGWEKHLNEATRCASFISALSRISFPVLIEVILTNEDLLQHQVCQPKFITQEQ